MSRSEVAKFKRLFDDWASVDVQLRTKNGDFGDGTQHQFIAFLLMYRKPIINALEFAAK
jgi:hypothetical protein